MDGETEAYRDDTLRSIAISPRERLAHIEETLSNIDKKLDTRFDSLEDRIAKVENVQSSQASIAVLAQKAVDLADAESKKAAGLAKTATDTAADLAKDATEKAADLANDQKDLVATVKFLTDRLDIFDRKLAWAMGAGAVLVALAGWAGHLIH